MTTTIMVGLLGGLLAALGRLLRGSRPELAPARVPAPAARRKRR